MALARVETLRTGPLQGAASELSFRRYLDQLERDTPEEVLHVHSAINPSAFEATAVLQRLEERNKYPLVVFDKPLALNGKPSAFPLVTNIYATRERCARALGLRPEQAYQDLGLEYARREERRIAPVVIDAAAAPVKQVVRRGDQADLRELPIVRHHRMDGGPYVDMTPVMRDP